MTTGPDKHPGDNVTDKVSASSCAKENVSDHGKLPWLTPEVLDEAQSALYEKITGGPRSNNPALSITDSSGRLEGPFNAMLLNPVVGDAVQQLGAAIRFHTGFTDREREIAILTLAVIQRSAFEFYAHSRIALKTGVSQQEINALERGKSPSTFSAEESLIRTTILQLSEDRDLDDLSQEHFVGVFGDQRLGELLTLVSYYELLALSLRVWRTPLPAS
jgi:alkylhydroperoxidase/carboxymuconolactone decarboxylase family protein YurZ